MLVPYLEISRLLRGTIHTFLDEHRLLRCSARLKSCQQEIIFEQAFQHSVVRPSRELKAPMIHDLEHINTFLAESNHYSLLLIQGSFKAELLTVGIIYRKGNGGQKITNPVLSENNLARTDSL